MFLYFMFYKLKYLYLYKLENKKDFLNIYWTDSFYCLYLQSTESRIAWSMLAKLYCNN